MSTPAPRTASIDGIGFTIHEATIPNGTVLVIASATGVLQTYYRHFATWMAGQGITTVTFDYTGIGASRTGRMRHCTATAQSWATHDLTTVIEHVSATLRPRRLLVLCHSIGGQLAGLCRAQDKIHGLAMVAAQLGYWRWWPKDQRWRLYFRWFILLRGLTKLLGYFPGSRIGVMEDLPGPMALEWSGWGLSPNYLFDHVPDAPERFANLRVPTLIWSFSDDRDLAPKLAVDKLAERFVNCTVRREHLSPADLGMDRIGHFGFFKKGGEARLWPALLERMRTLGA